MQDPAIHVDSKAKHPGDADYYPYKSGEDKDVFIKWPQDLILSITQVNPDSIGFDRTMLGKVTYSELL